ncbi:hypothetical protein ACHQM5_017889 [Ranunculus cassubicifolius]
MGCVASRKIDKEEKVQICKERKRLMKHLLVLRSQFAAAQMAYLQSLKNAGATLRQFTDSECLDIEILLPGGDDCYVFEQMMMPDSSPQTPLPPPPPPLPLFEDGDDEVAVVVMADMVVADGGDSAETSSSPASSPSAVPSSPWEIWDPFSHPSAASFRKKTEAAIVEQEENWSETFTEFEEKSSMVEDEEVGEEITDIVLTPLAHKSSMADIDSSSSALVAPKSAKKKTLSGIIKEIDEYFLKASASGRDVILVLDINKGGDSLYQNFGESMRKSSAKSSKVFSALSWSWSSRSLECSKDILKCYEPGEPCKPGAHGITLEKISSEEEKLYKETKGEENTKLECKRKTSLLQKYEGGNSDMLKTEELQTNIETLQYDICCFQQSISETNSTILKLVYDELHPQLILLSSGLMHMWKKMYECHQVQNHIAQQLKHLNNHPSVKPTTDYHRQSTTQLEAEVGGWYMSFCNLLKTQREYVQILNRWIQLTDFLVDGEQERDGLSIVQQLCEHWMLAMDHLPDKVAAEAIKSFLSVIHSIVMQQSEEQMLQKKSERLEKKLEREIDLLNEMEKKSETNIDSPNHPLAVKRAKIELFKKRVEDEKAKHLNSVQLSHTMTLNNLQKSLPNVFQALTAFSSSCVQTFEAINSHSKKGSSRDDGETYVCDEPSSSIDMISTLGL